MLDASPSVRAYSAIATKPLSERERRFVVAFVGSAAGNATKAAELAGYASVSAGVLGHRLLKKDNVRVAISQKVERSETTAIADRQERLEFLTGVIRDTAAPLFARLKACDQAAKMHGEYIQRVELGSTDLLDLLVGKDEPKQLTGRVM